MTDIVAAKEAIYKAFADAWGVTTKLTFDNEAFTPPANAAWVRLAVRHTASLQESLGRPGNRRFMRLGSVFVQVFTPIDKGVREADQLTKQAREIFEGKTLTGTSISFRNVTIREIGPDGKWYQANVEAEFGYDEIR